VGGEPEGFDLIDGSRREKKENKRHLQFSPFKAKKKKGSSVGAKKKGKK